MEQNRQYLRQQHRRRLQFRSWVRAAAAIVVLCIVSAVGVYGWTLRRNCPEIMYTIRLLPEHCTQAVRRTTPHTSCTIWNSDSGSIVLMQETNSLESLIKTQYHQYRMIREVHIDELDGRIYVNTLDGNVVLVWQKGKYSFLLGMDGTLSQEERLIQTAESLKVIDIPFFPL